MINRRELLKTVGGGLGSLALGTLLAEQAGRGTHHAARAKSVISLFMHGGPSHVDLYDPKPMLSKYDGKPPPAEVADDEKITGNLLGSPFQFRKHGGSGIELSETMPHLARHVDKLAVLRGMFTEHRNHEQALWMMHGGLTVAGRPSLGAWVGYALGSENRNLPAYVVLPAAGLPVDGIRNWSSGWLPPAHQGTPFRSEGTPILNLRPRVARPAAAESGRLGLLGRLNAEHRASRPGELELDARIASFELAARMQLEATDALDIAREPSAVQR
ncbi:MAG: DUF1501 domain-containing protein, partial [Gemmataceae bacterium]